MSTAMSTKRLSVPQQGVESVSGKNLSLIAFIGGFVLMVVGIMLNVTVLAIVGFAAFATTLLYYNSMFWAKMYESGKMSQKAVSQSWISRNF